MEEEMLAEFGKKNPRTWLGLEFFSLRCLKSLFLSVADGTCVP